MALKNLTMNDMPSPNTFIKASLNLIPSCRHQLQEHQKHPFRHPGSPHSALSLRTPLLSEMPRSRFNKVAKFLRNVSKVYGPGNKLRRTRAADHFKILLLLLILLVLLAKQRPVSPRSPPGGARRPPSVGGSAPVAGGRSRRAAAG